MATLALHLDAGHDRNGNPRRCYVIIDGETGRIIESIDEGYQAFGVVERKYKD